MAKKGLMQNPFGYEFRVFNLTQQELDLLTDEIGERVADTLVCIAGARHKVGDGVNLWKVKIGATDVDTALLIQDIISDLTRG